MEEKLVLDLCAVLFDEPVNITILIFYLCMKINDNSHTYLELSGFYHRRVKRINSKLVKKNRQMR